MPRSADTIGRKSQPNPESCQVASLLFPFSFSVSFLFCFVLFWLPFRREFRDRGFGRIHPRIIRRIRTTAAKRFNWQIQRKLHFTLGRILQSHTETIPRQSLPLPQESPENPQRILRESPENLQRIPQDDAPIGSKPSSGEREREEGGGVRGCQRMSEDARRCLRVRADPRTQSKSQRCNRDGTSGFDTQRRHRNRSELNANSTNRCHRLFLSPTSCLLPPLPTHLGSTIQTRLQSHNNNNNNNNDSINHNNILK